MRVLILCAETREKRDIEKDLISQKDSEMETSKDTPAEQAEKEKHKAAQKAAEKEAPISQKDGEMGTQGKDEDSKATVNSE